MGGVVSLIIGVLTLLLLLFGVVVPDAACALEGDGVGEETEELLDEGAAEEVDALLLLFEES